jgi:hypothetical protein
MVMMPGKQDPRYLSLPDKAFKGIPLEIQKDDSSPQIGLLTEVLPLLLLLSCYYVPTIMHHVLS